MKYLKLFNENIKTESWIDDEFKSIEDIAKLIDSYFRDHDYTDIMTKMCDILISVNDDIEWYDDLLRYDDILSSITILFDNYKDPWYSVRFERFLSYLSEIQNESQHNLSIDEIEDLFLDLDYKYDISKVNISYHGDNVPAFKVEISKVTESDSIMLINRFFNTVSRRLPKEYKIKKLEMEREKDGVYFTLIIIKEYPESSQ